MLLLEGVYGSFKLTEESTKKLSDWIEENEIVEPVQDDDLHITTTYSKADPEKEIEPSESKNIRLSSKDFAIATYGRALVIEVESKELEDIHDAAIAAGASYDYETYKPHITISYNAEANENIIPLLFPPDFDIILSHEEIEPLKLKETFEMEHEYYFWGWIKPDGKLLIPSEDMRYSPKLYNHQTLMNVHIKDRGSKGGYALGYERGYCKFAIETTEIDGVGFLTLECPLTANPETIQIGYNNILTSVKKKSLDIYRIFGKTLERIVGKYFYLVLDDRGNKSKYYDNSLENMLADFKKYQLKEAFELGDFYKFWGWIKPNGALLLPNEDMRIEYGKWYNHNSLYNEYSSRSGGKSDAYDNGYIRFSVDQHGALNIQCTISIDGDLIVKGVANIRNYIRNNSLDIYKIFNHSISLNDIRYFTYQLIEKLDKKYSIISRGEGNSIGELLNDIKKYQKKIQAEELPANSTANIATYSKPLTPTIRRKYFKDFKKKLEIETKGV